MERYFQSENTYSSKKSSLKTVFLPAPIPSQDIYRYFPKSDEDLHGEIAYKVFNTTKNKKDLLPKSCCYFYNNSILVKNGVEKFLFQSNSNGGGGGVTEEDAKLSAIYELIERDAFLLHWLTKVPPLRINKESLPVDLKSFLITASTRYHLSIDILDTTYDTNIFSCIVVITDSIKNKVTLGGSAGLDIPTVIRKAYSEALLGLHIIKKDPPLITYSKKYLDETPPFSDPRMNHTERQNFYSTSDGIKCIRDTLLQGEIVDYKKIKDLYQKPFVENTNNREKELQSIINTFKKLTEKKGAGYNLYFYEYKDDILTDSNYHVVKAFVPSLIKLWLKEDLATPWSPRVLEFAKLHNKEILMPEDLNPLPHPFP